VKNSRTHLDRS